MKRVTIAQKLNAQSRSGEAGNRKIPIEHVKEFKRRLAQGMSRREAREGLRIARSSGDEIATGRSWASVVILVFVVLVSLGNSCDGGGNGAYADNDRRACWTYDYPLCSEVPITYPCLCVQGQAAVTSVEDERELLQPVPTDGYEYEGGEG